MNYLPASTLPALRLTQLARWWPVAAVVLLVVLSAHWCDGKHGNPLRWQDQ